jgi:hypothetical protein
MTPSIINLSLVTAMLALSEKILTIMRPEFVVNVEYLK